MSLQTRLATLIQQIGADVKELFARIEAIEPAPFIDAGLINDPFDETIDAGGV